MKDWEKMKRGERGITLIALIITIIVLVILAAVSIRAITEQSIVGHAVNGSQEYARAGKEENRMLEETGNLIEDAVAKLNETKDATEFDPIVYIDGDCILRRSGKFSFVNFENLKYDEYIEATSENLYEYVLFENVKYVSQNYLIMDNGDMYDYSGDLMRRNITKRLSGWDEWLLDGNKNLYGRGIQFDGVDAACNSNTLGDALGGVYDTVGIFRLSGDILCVSGESLYRSVNKCYYEIKNGHKYVEGYSWTVDLTNAVRMNVFGFQDSNGDWTSWFGGEKVANGKFYSCPCEDAIIGVFIDDEGNVFACSSYETSSGRKNSGLVDLGEKIKNIYIINSGPDRGTYLIDNDGNVYNIVSSIGEDEEGRSVDVYGVELLSSDPSVAQYLENHAGKATETYSYDFDPSEGITYIINNSELAEISDMRRNETDIHTNSIDVYTNNDKQYIKAVYIVENID